MRKGKRFTVRLYLQAWVLLLHVIGSVILLPPSLLPPSTVLRFIIIIYRIAGSRKRERVERRAREKEKAKHWKKDKRRCCANREITIFSRWFKIFSASRWIKTAIGMMIKWFLNVCKNKVFVILGLDSLITFVVKKRSVFSPANTLTYQKLVECLARCTVGIVRTAHLARTELTLVNAKSPRSRCGTITPALQRTGVMDGEGWVPVGISGQVCWFCWEYSSLWTTLVSFDQGHIYEAPKIIRGAGPKRFDSLFPYFDAVRHPLQPGRKAARCIKINQLKNITKYTCASTWKKNENLRRHGKSVAS